MAGDDLGLLIGPGGRTLAAVQDLARVAAQRRLGDHETRLRVDVAGYRERRRAALETFARTVAAQVAETGTAAGARADAVGRPQGHPRLLATIDGVASHSEGDDPTPPCRRDTLLNVERAAPRLASATCSSARRSAQRLGTPRRTTGRGGRRARPSVRSGAGADRCRGRRRIGRADRRPGRSRRWSTSAAAAGSRDWWWPSDRPDLAVTLVDRRQKCTDFLERIDRRRSGCATDVSPCGAVTRRVLITAGERFDAVTARGFGPPERTLRSGGASGPRRRADRDQRATDGDRWSADQLERLGLSTAARRRRRLHRLPPQERDANDENDAWDHRPMAPTVFHVEHRAGRNPGSRWCRDRGVPRETISLWLDAVVGRRETLLLDGAHRPDCADHGAESLRASRPRRAAAAEGDRRRQPEGRGRQDDHGDQHRRLPRRARAAHTDHRPRSAGQRLDRARASRTAASKRRCTTS